MDLNAKLKWGTIAGLAAVAAAAMLAEGLTLRAWDLPLLAAIVAPLALAARWSRRRGYDDLACSLVAGIQFTLFTCGYTVVMCVATMADRPLIDEALMRADAWFGVHVPDVVAWARRHSVLDALLALCYHTIVLQTVVTILVLGLAGDRRPLDGLLLRLMLAALITLAVFAAFPAVGPFVGYASEYDMSAHDTRFLHDFEAWRNRERDWIVLFHLEGLITFPSFHAAWAVLIALAYVHRPALFACFGLLNVGVIVSTMTLGSHYWIDVLAGIAIAGVAVCATGLVEGCAAVPRQ